MNTSLALNVFWATGLYIMYGCVVNGISRHDLELTVKASILCTLWLIACAGAARVGSMSKETSRKLLHAGTIPLFLITWTWSFPSNPPAARYASALVPWLTTAVLTVAGMGFRIFPLTILVGAVSRSGQPRELHEGPLLYGIAASWGPILGWGEAWIGVGPMLILAAGDAAAALIGKAVGGPRLPWNRSKTWAGTVGFVLASAAALFWWGDVYGGTPGVWYGGGFMTSSDINVLLGAIALGAGIESLWYAEDNILIWAGTTLFLYFFMN